MKKNAILSALVVLVIIACILFIRDGLTYLITSLMALAIIGVIHLNRRTVMKITRWAKNNPGKTQVLITVLQLVLMAVGILAGNNLREMGYEFSNATAYIFSTIIIAGFLSIPFLPKRNIIAIPAKVNRHRLSYISIALSSFVMMAVFGNRVVSDYPNSTLTHTVRSIDRAIFADNSASGDFNDADPEPAYDRNYGQSLTDESSNSNIAIFAAYTIYDKEAITPSTLSKEEARAKLKAEKKAKRFERKKQKIVQLIFKKRPALVVAMGVGAVLLIVLLVITTCAGVCLMIGGFAGGGVGYGLLGLVVAAASIFGIVKISKANKKKT